MMVRFVNVSCASRDRPLSAPPPPRPPPPPSPPPPPIICVFFPCFRDANTGAPTIVNLRVKSCRICAAISVPIGLTLIALAFIWHEHPWATDAGGLATTTTLTSSSNPALISTSAIVTVKPISPHPLTIVTTGPPHGYLSPDAHELPQEFLDQMPHLLASPTPSTAQPTSLRALTTFSPTPTTPSHAISTASIRTVLPSPDFHEPVAKPESDTPPPMTGKMRKVVYNQTRDETFDESTQQPSSNHTAGDHGDESPGPTADNSTDIGVNPNDPPPANHTESTSESTDLSHVPHPQTTVTPHPTVVITPPPMIGDIVAPTTPGGMPTTAMGFEVMPSMLPEKVMPTFIPDSAATAPVQMSILPAQTELVSAPSPTPLPSEILRLLHDRSASKAIAGSPASLNNPHTRLRALLDANPGLAATYDKYKSAAEQDQQTMELSIPMLRTVCVFAFQLLSLCFACAVLRNYVVADL
jgi:hypothetical protein